MSTVSNRPENHQETEPDQTTPTDAVVRDPVAFGLCFLVIGSLLVAVRQFNLALPYVVTGRPPPLLPFLLILLAALGLLFAYERQKRLAGESAVAEPAGEAPALHPALAALGFSALPAGLRNRRTILLLGSLLLTLLILIQIPRLGQENSYLLVFLLWLGAIVTYFGAVVPRQHSLRDSWHSGRAYFATAWANHRFAVIALALIMVAAFLLRVVAVGTLPHNLSGDEASQGLEALRVLNGEIRNPFTTGWLSVPTMSFFFNSLTIGLFGPTSFALRLPWVLVGSATVLVSFFLAKRLTNLPLALATAALVAVYHYHIHYSRLGSNQIADPLFVALALLFLMRALDRHSRFDWAMTGLICALALYFYAGARFTPIVVGVVLLYAFIRAPRRFMDNHLPGVGVMLGAFFIAGAPMLQFATRFPDDFNARINQVGILQSGWLEDEVLLTGRSATAILWDQFRRAVLAYNYYPDRTVWYGLREPLLDPVFGVLFLLGLAFGTLRCLGDEKGQRLAPMVVWWWGGIILGGMLTESPPSTQRLVTTAVPTCFFIALALWELLQLLERAIGGIPKQVLMAVGVLVFAFISLQTYFVEFAPQRIYGGPYAELGTDIAPFLNDRADSHTTYFVGPPWMYWGFATLPYLVPDMPAEDVVEPIQSPADLPEPTAGRGAIFIVLPQRKDELPVIQATFPNGELQEIRATATDSRLMAYIYVVPPP